MGEQEASIKPIQCPQCRSLNIGLTESFLTAAFYLPGHEEGFASDSHDPFKVEGICRKCKHEWRLKGVIQMTEALKDRLQANWQIMKGGISS